MKTTELPKVSILIPVYNVEKYIERCARSVFEQTYENLEYVFVDDCSPDKSIDILQRVVEDYPHRAPHVRIIHHKENKGLAAVRNTLVDACNTEFLSFVDSDDYITPNAVELLVKRQIETGADIVTGRVMAVTQDGEKPYKYTGFDLNKEEALLGMLSNNSVSHILCGRLLKTSLIKSNAVRSYEGLNYGEDFSVMPRLLYFVSSISGIPDYIYVYDRQNPNSYTFNYEKDWNLQKQALKSYEVLQSFFADKCPSLVSALALLTFNKYREIVFYTALNKNKRGFNVCRRYLRDNKNFYSTVKYSGLMQLIESSYYLARVVNPLRLLRAKILLRYR